MTERIVIVEDDPIVSTDLENLVRGFGYDVVAVVPSGEEAIGIVEDQRPDLVMMDITLEGELDGVDTATIIGERFRIPVVYLTAHSDKATLERAKLTKPYGYVLKPFQEIEIQIALQMALFTGAHPRAETPKSQGLDEQHLKHEHRPLENATEQATVMRVCEALNQIPPFAKVPSEHLRDFVAACHVEKYEAHKMVMMEGDEESEEGFIVLSGRVSMLKTSASGREFIVELLPPGDTFGLVAGLGDNTYPLTARSQSKCEILHVPRKAFLGLLADVPQLYRLFLEDISRRLRKSHAISRSLAHDRVEVRIAAALTKLSKRLVPAGNDGPTVLQITRREIADLTGTTVETAIRVTRAMEEDGILDFPENGMIRILNLPALAHIAEDAMES